MTTTSRPSAPSARVRLTEHQREALLSGITAGPTGRLHPMTGVRTIESLVRRGLAEWDTARAGDALLTDAGRAAVGHPTPSAAVAALVEIDDQRPADDDTDQGVTVALSDTDAVNARWDALAADQAAEIDTLFARNVRVGMVLTNRPDGVDLTVIATSVDGDDDYAVVRPVTGGEARTVQMDQGTGMVHVRVAATPAVAADQAADDRPVISAHRVAPGMTVTELADETDRDPVTITVATVRVSGDRVILTDESGRWIDRAAWWEFYVDTDARIDVATRVLVADQGDAIVRGTVRPGRDAERVAVPAGTAVTALRHPVPAYVSLVGETDGQAFLFVVRRVDLDTVAPVASDRTLPVDDYATPRVMVDYPGMGDQAADDDAQRDGEDGWAYLRRIYARGDDQAAAATDTPAVAAETAVATSGRTRSAERTEFLSDVLCVALEGGIGYWSAASDISRVTEPGGLVGWRYDAVTLWETDGGREPGECSQWEALGLPRGATCPGHRVTLDTVASAVNRISKTTRDACPDAGGFAYRYVTQVRDASIENDASDVDADVADIVVQVAALGSVIYG